VTDIGAALRKCDNLPTAPLMPMPAVETGVAPADGT